MSRKKVAYKGFVAVLIAGATLSTVACGTVNSKGDSSNSVSSSGGATGAGGGSKTVTLWVRTGTPLPAAVKLFNQKLKSEGSSYKIKVVELPNSDVPTKFSAAIAANQEPDLISMDVVLAPQFAQMGAFKDLTSFYNNLSNKGDLIQSMVRQGQYKGKQYAIPEDADVSAILYNKTLFKQVGITTPPKTWKEIMVDAKKLTDPSKKQYGYVYPGADGGFFMFTFLPYVWANGGSLLNSTGTKSMLDQKPAVQALQFFQDLNKSGVMEPNAASATANQVTSMFENGHAGMIGEGTFMVDTLDTQFPKLKYGVVPVPSKDGSKFGSFAGGDEIAIPAGAKNPKIAEQFIKFVLSPKVQTDLFAKNGDLPVVKTDFKNKYFQKNKAYQPFLTALENSQVPYTTVYNQLYKPVVSAMQNALMDKGSAQTIFNNTSSQINKILKSKH